MAKSLGSNLMAKMALIFCKSSVQPNSSMYPRGYRDAQSGMSASARNLSPKDQTGLQKGDIGIAVKIRQPAIQNSLHKMISTYPYLSTIGIVVFYLRFSISPVIATMGQVTKIKALCLWVIPNDKVGDCC